jgi:hypothetical protein
MSYKHVCIKDLRMEINGRLVFSKGEIYKSRDKILISGSTLLNNSGRWHSIGEKWLKHFQLPLKYTLNNL